MSRNSKKVLGVLAIVAVAVLGAVHPAQAESPKKVLEGQAKAMIAIKGMTCGGCCTKVETAVAELKGVVDVKADYQKGIAIVTFDVAQVNVAKIVATINEKTSFEATAPILKKKKKTKKSA